MIRDIHEFVKLIAGTTFGASSFIVHKNYATYHSPVLRAALNSDFIEGQSQAYTFEDDFDREVINLLANWFYTEQIYFGGVKLDSSQASDGTQLTEAGCIVKLWILADKLLMPRLQNMAMDELSEYILDETTFSPELLSWVYDNTAPESPLRQYLVFEFTYNHHYVIRSRIHNYFPPEMLSEMFVALRETSYHTGIIEERRENNEVSLYHVPES